MCCLVFRGRVDRPWSDRQSTPVERTKQIAEELVKLFGHSTLTAEEIAGYFRVTPSQVHRRLGGIAMRIGCVRRYRVVDIAEALAGPWTRDAA